MPRLRIIIRIAKLELACTTHFNKGPQEGTVNMTKAIKRSIYNRANADVLRAKMIYGGMKWDCNHHPK